VRPFQRPVWGRNEVRRWAVKAVGVASLAACVGLAVAVPSANPAGPGVWTNVEGPNLLALSTNPTAVRGQDGSLFAAFSDANGDLAVSKIGADGTRLSTVVAIPGGNSPGPAIGRDPTTGELRVMYGGFRSPPGESGTYSATAPAAGTPWSSVAKIANLSGATTVTAVGLDGTVFLGQAGGNVSLHRGTDPADPDHTYQASCCSQDAGLAVDGASGAPYLAWITGSPERRLTVRQGSASTGEPVGGALEAPGLGGTPADAIVEQMVTISGRVGAAGVYAAYADRDTDPGELLLWRVGDPAPRQAAIVDGNITNPALAPAPDGSLWIMWYEDAASDKIAARQLRPDGTTLGPITRLDPPPSPVFESIGQITGAAQADRLDLLASGTQRRLYHTQVLAVPSQGGGGGGGGGGGPGALSGVLSGRVTQTDGAPVPNALVEACPQPSGLCLAVYTDADGRYRFDGLAPGPYVVTAWPPPRSFLNVTKHDGVSTVAAGGELSGQDIVMPGPLRLPKNVALFGPAVQLINGVPVIRRNEELVVSAYWGNDIDRSQITITNDDGPTTVGCEPDCPPPIVDKPMTKAKDWKLPPCFGGLCYPPFPEPNWWVTLTVAELQLGSKDGFTTCIHAYSDGRLIDTFCYTTWIDPSGFVRTTLKKGLPGAKVVLFRSGSPAGPFEQVENGSAIMAPQNRRNPDVTDAFGHFGWDVISGYYKVRATHKGCSSPGSRKQKFVDTRVYEIPPPVTDIDLRMRCPPPPAGKKKPNVAGKARVGRTLTCSRGKWRNKPKRYDYLWQRGRAPIFGATKRRYRLSRADRGNKISCLVRAGNSYGNSIARSKRVRVR
jgi:hypothetical protein